ncbi:PD-(D/E)XK nuclease family protein [Streptomyces sp. NRRL F-4489]|uniref:PD-(D/E)XK nuclease family protein n=1 Tax=Streptomyces sp. NRRL F-4489 TaxID=1609095 RepID=UPI001F44FBE0|nr:PD-(D/E)XK nuclease family protein [Streptomyces sp. NRRL F-4489]
MFKDTGYRCPAADAMKARGCRPRARPESTRETLEHFAFGPFMKASHASVHDGLQQWTAHAHEHYGAAFPEDPASPMTEVPAWSYRYQLPEPDQRGAREYRITVWGRCLRSPDGTRRELRLPVNRIKDAEPHRGHVAAAALATAEGIPGPLPERVRIVEFALLDGRTRTLFEGTRAEAVERYRKGGGPEALSAVLDGREFRPGSSCTGCAYLAVCPALRRAPGLLGVTGEGRPRRTWSVTNGRSYRACPARDHMRRLHLPAAQAVERSPSAERGRAVHAYLAERHGLHRPCTVDVPAQWVPDGFELPEEEQRLGALLLRRHAAVCPLRCVRDRSAVRVEPRVVRHDPFSDVLVIAEPDLLYRDGDSWVWRETKTSATGWGRPEGLLERYPQLALAALLLSRGDLGGSPTRARIELEVLRPAGADLEIVDPRAPEIRAAAEETVRGLVADWHRDDHYAPTPGAACTRCEVARWCSARANEKEAA